MQSSTEIIGDQNVNCRINRRERERETTAEFIKNIEPEFVLIQLSNFTDRMKYLYDYNIA
jgi:hypothetical protein